MIYRDELFYSFYKFFSGMNLQEGEGAVLRRGLGRHQLSRSAGAIGWQDRPNLESRVQGGGHSCGAYGGHWQGEIGFSICF